MNPSMRFASPGRAVAAGLSMLLLAGFALAAAPAAESSSDRSQPSEEQTQRELDAARHRLEQAAQEVAQLSARLGAEGQQFGFFNSGRGIIGLQLDPENGPGARIAEVSPGGPAEEAGVHEGDIIVAVDGVKIEGTNPARQVLEHMSHVRPGHEVRLKVLRDGKPREFTLTTRSAFAMQMAPLESLGPELLMPRVRAFAASPEIQYFRELGEETSGMELATLTPALGRYFGTDHGVLVLRAPSSDAFHLQDGDVILSIDGREPRSGAHATRILRSYQPGEHITLHVLREKHPVTLTATMPELPGIPGVPLTPPTPPTPATPPAPGRPPAPAEDSGTL